MAAPFFVTASGTDIGKTLVTATLCWQLRERGRKVTALKPIITGFREDDPENDTAVILRSCGLKSTPELVRTISPWRFRAPLAPNLAAAREDTAIEFENVVSFCKSHAALDTDVLLAEGAGGVMAPLDNHHTMLDLMELLDWRVILVGGSYLGSLSHTLATLEVLRTRGLVVAALIIIESEQSRVTLDETAAGFGALVTANIPMIKLPRVRNQAEPWKHQPNISWICA